MRDAVLTHGAGADALIMAAAVADFRPAVVAEQKIKKAPDADDAPTLELVRNPDILLAVHEQPAEQRPRIVVGFAAESEHLRDHARDKLRRKGLNLLVANDISAADAGFNVDTNRVILFDDAGGEEALDLMSKTRVAEHLIGRIAALL
jgi:phosphopantothenoylcysteine decarboxylase/phosphopantothenate--cysteine ligase